MLKNVTNFLVLVINEAENLTKDAQHALRRTMEKYMKNMRIILCCNNGARLIAPIKSRCLIIRIPSPSIQALKSALKDILIKEGNIIFPEDVLFVIAKNSNGNLRKAILLLECTKSKAMLQNLNIQTLQACVVPSTDWESALEEVASMVIGEQSTAK